MNICDKMMELKKGEIVFLAESVSHNNIESLSLISKIIQIIGDKRKIKIYMEGLKIIKKYNIKQQLYTVDNGFNSLSFADFYSKYYDVLEFVDVDIWDLFSNTLTFTDILMTEYQKNKDKIVSDRIIKDIHSSDCDIYFVYFGISHSYMNWYDKDWGIYYNRLLFYLRQYGLPVTVIRLCSLKKVDFNILKTGISNKKLEGYTLSYNEKERVYNVILPSTAIDFPCLLLEKRLSKKILARYPLYYKYKMNNYKYLYEIDRFRFFNKIKKIIRKQIGFNKQLIKSEFRLYFSIGALFSDTYYISSSAYLKFILYVILNSQYLMMFTNYLMWIGLLRVKQFDKITDNTIAEIKYIIIKKRHLFIKVTRNDKLVRELFLKKIETNATIQKENIPLIDYTSWHYKNIFSFEINN